MLLEFSLIFGAVFCNCFYVSITSFSGVFWAHIRNTEQNFREISKGGKFLKKMWCCVGGSKLQGNLVLSTELIM